MDQAFSCKGRFSFLVAKPGSLSSQTALPHFPVSNQREADEEEEIGGCFAHLVAKRGSAALAPVSDSTALRALKRTGRVLAADYTRERRDLAAARRAAFVVPPSGPNEVWQMDFSGYATTQGGTWQISGCADYWAKAELGWHVSMTQNHRDAITAIELAIHEAETLLSHSLLKELTDPLTGPLRPIAR